MRGNSLAKVFTLPLNGERNGVAARYRPGVHLSNAISGAPPRNFALFAAGIDGAALR